jgi:tetratricopeptide (TPR) repeat protein
MKHKLTWFVLSLALILGCGESKEDRDAATHLKLGIAEYNAKRYEGAIAEFSKAVATKPDFAEAYFNMGNAYYKLKQYEATLSAYEKYIHQGIQPQEHGHHRSPAWPLQRSGAQLGH